MEKNKIEKVEKNFYMNLIELPNKAAYMDINERMDAKMAMDADVKKKMSHGQQNLVLAF